MGNERRCPQVTDRNDRARKVIDLRVQLVHQRKVTCDVDTDCDVDILDGDKGGAAIQQEFVVRCDVDIGSTDGHGPQTIGFGVRTDIDVIEIIDFCDKGAADVQACRGTVTDCDPADDVGCVNVCERTRARDRTGGQQGHFVDQQDFVVDPKVHVAGGVDYHAFADGDLGVQIDVDVADRACAAGQTAGVAVDVRTVRYFWTINEVCRAHVEVGRVDKNAIQIGFHGVCDCCVDFDTCTTDQACAECKHLRGGAGQL